MAEHPEIKHVRLYRDTCGEFRFAAHATNGEIIVTSSESYVDKRDALAAAVSVFPGADLVDETIEASG